MLSVKVHPLLLILLFAMLAATACTLPGGTAETGEAQTFSGPPLITITSPLPNATYLENIAIQIGARVENAGTDIESIEVRLDGAVIGSQASPNPGGAAVFTVAQELPAASVGQHSLEVLATREDGTTGSATVSFTVVEQASLGGPGSTDNDTSGGQTQTQPSSTPPAANTPVPAAPTNTPPPTVAPTNTPVPASPTSSVPMARLTAGANVRSGPSTAFEPPIGSLAAGAEVRVLGVNPARTWYKVQYYNGEGWVWHELVTVTGDTASLPVDAGPPTPVPATPTTPPTATSTSNVNLTLSVTINPHPFVCNQASELTIVVSNIGTADSPGGSILVEDLYNGVPGATTTAAFPAVPAGGSVTVNQVFLTVTTNYAEAHQTRVTVDPNNLIPESDKSNNVNISTYVLAQGGCP